MTDKPQLKVKVYSQLKIYYEGLADSVSATSKAGPFDILPGHANFFTLLVASEVTIISASQAKTITVAQGIAQVVDNHLKVFVDV